MVRERAQLGWTPERKHTQAEVCRTAAFGFEQGLTGYTRLKLLKEGAYSQQEAEAAVGLRTDNGPKQAARENTQNIEVEMENSGFIDEEIVT